MSEVLRDISLSSSAEVLPDALRIRYAVHNKGRDDIYLLDRLAAAPADKTGAGLYVCWRGRSTVLVLRGIAPLPTNRDVKVRIVPLGTLVQPGRKAERELLLPLPLAEQGPYDPPLPPGSGAPDTASHVVLRVEFLRGSADGFVAEPGPVDGTFKVRARHTVGQAESLENEIAVPPLKVLRRDDAFGRL
jgi:hypothetical protein